MLLCNLDAYRSRPGVVLARSRPKASFVLNGLDGGETRRTCKVAVLSSAESGPSAHADEYLPRRFRRPRRAPGGRAAGQPDVRPARAFAYSYRSASSPSVSFDHGRLVCFPFTASATAPSSARR